LIGGTTAETPVVVTPPIQSGASNLVDDPQSLPSNGGARGGSNGNGAGKPPPPGPGTIIKSQVAERWVSQVSRGATPEILAQYIDESITGNTLNLFAFYEEIEEKWPEFRIAAYKHKLKAARRNPRLVPPDKPQNPDLAKRKADHAIYQFGQMRNWHSTAFNLLDAVGKGVSAGEIDWQIGSVLGQQAALINEIAWVNYRHLGWWWDKPELQLFPDLRNRAYHIDVPDRKFVVFHHLSKSGHPSRAAMLRPLSWYFLIYLYAIKDWSTLAETFGIDVAWATCNKDATKEQRNLILGHLARIASRAGVFDEGTILNILRAASGSGGGPPQEGLAKYCAERAIECLLGSTLATQAGDKGARSLGLVQQDETEELIDWTCLLFAGTITSGPLRWMMDFNFAEPGDNPVMELPGANRRDLQALANVINILTQLGVQIPEAWVHSQFDIPVPKALAGAAPAAAAGNTERVLTPSKSGGGGSGGAGNPDSISSGEALTSRDPVAQAALLGGHVFTEEQAQSALNAIRQQAIAQGRDTGAFDQLARPLKDILTGKGEPAEMMAQIHKVAGQLDPVKLQGIAKEMFILADLVGAGRVHQLPSNVGQASPRGALPQRELTPSLPAEGGA
jgi:phage gp29-like protein